MSFLHRLPRRLLELVRRYPGRTAAIVPLLALAYVLALIPSTPGIGDLRKTKSETPSVVLTADGQMLTQFRRLNREWVPLGRISPHVIDALISTEDNRFYHHAGINLLRMISAAGSTLAGDRQGGSTLTQQLARNLYPQEIGNAPTLNRKVREAITALNIEVVYSKDEILETYLNTVPFLYNAYGIEMAARTYFDKSADKLDVLESATLIGMLKGTSYYNPVSNPERALQRRNLVLAQMARHGKLPKVPVAALQARPLKLDFERQGEAPGPAPHAAQVLRKWLIDWADRHGHDVYADGLVLRTTLDSRLQALATDSVTRQADAMQVLSDRGHARNPAKPQLQAGFMALDPRTGHIRAWVGSRNFAQDQFDHVQQARRQPGSTFKPFVYGAAFMQGAGPGDQWVDQPVAIRVGTAVWRPSDATRASYAPMTLRDGLVYSKNTITAQVVDQVGPQRVADLARALGVRQSPLEVVPSLALGTSPVTLREMVTAYASLANQGRYIEPVLVTRVEDRNGKLLEQFDVRTPEQAMPRDLALTLVDVMRGVIDEGTGVAVRQRYGLQGDYAGKTGTTQDNTDGWFIMMHPHLVAGAWMGFQDNRATMGDAWGQGARSALPIVAGFYQQALQAQLVDPQAAFPVQRQQYPRGVLHAQARGDDAGARRAPARAANRPRHAQAPPRQATSLQDLFNRLLGGLR